MKGSFMPHWHLLAIGGLVIGLLFFLVLTFSLARHVHRLKSRLKHSSEVLVPTTTTSTTPNGRTATLVTNGHVYRQVNGTPPLSINSTLTWGFGGRYHNYNTSIEHDEMVALRDLDSSSVNTSSCCDRSSSQLDTFKPRPNVSSPLDSLTRLRDPDCQEKQVQIVFRHGDKMVELECRLLPEDQQDQVQNQEL